jgi:predicted nuclease of predicted toxin-antitoxin system
MRLLLDEHFAPEIAASLCERGHDVVAVTERDDLRHLPDEEILLAARAEGRSVVTEDAKDFMPIVALRAFGREQHPGVVFVSPRSFPRRRDGFGRLIRALDALHVAHPGEDDLAGDVIWLRPLPEDAG